jgi:hypothetical protein
MSSVQAQLYHSVSALDRDVTLASRSGFFTPGKKAYRTHRIVGCVEPRAGLDVLERRKYIAHIGNQTASVQQVARCYTDLAIQTSFSAIQYTCILLEDQ